MEACRLLIIRDTDQNSVIMKIIYLYFFIRILGIENIFQDTHLLISDFLGSLPVQV